MNRMTCKSFDEIVHGLVRFELLDIAMREEALAHAARCAQCAERMAAARVLAEATGVLAEAAREEQAPVRVERELVSAFRARHRKAVWWHVFEWSTAGAVAAMGLLLMWNVYGRTKAPSSPAPRRDVSAQSQEPIEASAAQTNGSADLSAEIASTVGDLNENDFVPVPYAADLDPQEPGMIVRVELTPDSLAELGYPIAAVSGDDLISADVLVGEDGWPRAVRLVQ